MSGGVAPMTSRLSRIWLLCRSENLSERSNGADAPYTDGVFTLAYAHLLLEVNAAEEEIEYSVGELTDRKLPAIILP